MKIKYIYRNITNKSLNLLKNLTLIIPAKDEALSLPIFLKELEKYEFSILIITSKNDNKTLSSIKKSENIRHISIAPLMGEAIKRINSDSSVSALFD